MKLLTLIVHTDVQQDLIKLLNSLDTVSGFTFSKVEGHGQESETDSFLSARDKVVGVSPRTRLDLLLEDQHVDTILNTLKEKQHNIAGNAAYWVCPVEKGGHLS